MRHIPLAGGLDVPLSNAVADGDLVVTAGQAPLGPDGRLVGPDIETQVEAVLASLDAVLQAAGSDRAHVLRTECFLARAEDFAAFNAIYARWFPAPSPARTTVVCGFVVPGMLVEVQALARQADADGSAPVST